VMGALRRNEPKPYRLCLAKNAAAPSLSICDAARWPRGSRRYVCDDEAVLHCGQAVVDHRGELPLQTSHGRGVCLALGAFAVVVLSTGVRLGRHLSDRDDVQQPIQLPIATSVDANGDTATAGAGPHFAANAPAFR
jgi:hypothetical protein